jgi:hypothetical protein
MNIRFLYFAGCPNSAPALILLRETLHELNIEEHLLDVREVGDMEEAEQCGFLGSPTIQVNSADIEESRRHDKSAYCCRIYMTGDGPTGIPPKPLLVKALSAAKAIP